MKAIPLIFASIILFPVVIAAQEGVFIGGELGMTIPLNLKSSDDIGFSDVASPGILIGLTGKWIYEKRLSLDAELNYQYNPANMQFWDVARYGDVTAHYQTASVLFSGKYYFSHKSTRPYTGIAFGGFFIFNDLSFVSSYTGTDNDRSVSYKINMWKPGFAPETGVVFELNRNTLLDLNASLILIPNIEDETVTEYIDGWPVLINKNPHANQHHLRFSVALLFKTKNRFR
ncbi:MAG: hypothetical protein GXO47_15005 [Chlorobi bacterium]|nr:hypothetical protein [Chlorobiota bacterium]